MIARALLATVVALFFSLPSMAAGRIETDDGRPGATVLCYHIVESPQDPRMEISRETFRQHLRYLEMTGYNVIPLRDLYEFVSGKRASIPENSVVITIDDGWRSTYTEAFPELKKRGFPFTIFIYPEIIGRTSIALSWAQIREMQTAGADIQSHTYSHGFLTRQRHLSMDDDQYAKWLRHELRESKRVIEKQTGKSVEFLAYPYGDYDTSVAASAGKAGYKAALTCDFGRVRSGSNPLRMKRMVIDKRMDFAVFRHYMGTSTMELAEVTPSPVQNVNPGVTVVSARIPNYKSLNPESVGLALLSLGTITPYSYDARTGAISLVVKDSLTALKGNVHRALVWATDAKTGKRVEASWTFRLPDPALPDQKAQPATATPTPPPIAAQVLSSAGTAVATAVRDGRGTLHEAPRK